MRSIGLLAVVTGTLVLTSACGNGADVSPPDNAAPVANFTVPSCTIGVPCDFVSTSTDDTAVTAWSWDFNGDGNADANTANATFTYTTAGTFNVSLTVHDAEGLSHTKTSAITIDSVEPPANTPPTAGFTHTCTALDCSFTSTSTDAAPGTIAAYAWDFGDGAKADVANPSHSYTVTAPADFTVTLSVTDDQGATDTVTQTVSVTPVVAPNTPPTAGFTHTCNAATCSFTSTSTDVAPGTIVAFAWTFGDGGTADVENPSHSYSIVAPTDFTVTLTVTDDEGATGVETQTITVSPPVAGAEGCTTTGTQVDCLLDITAQSIIKFKLLGLSCDLRGERVTVPHIDQSFLNVCARSVGDSTKIFGGPADSAIVFPAGSQVRIRFSQGTADAGEPAPAPPEAHLTGSFPSWTINFEDGDNAGTAGEPDFTDVVLGVEAVAFP